MDILSSIHPLSFSPALISWYQPWGAFCSGAAVMPAAGATQRGRFGRFGRFWGDFLKCRCHKCIYIYNICIYLLYYIILYYLYIHEFLWVLFHWNPKSCPKETQQIYGCSVKEVSWRRFDRGGRGGCHERVRWWLNRGVPTDCESPDEKRCSTKKRTKINVASSKFTYLCKIANRYFVDKNLFFEKDFLLGFLHGNSGRPKEMRQSSALQEAEGTKGCGWPPKMWAFGNQVVKHKNWC